MLSKNEQFLLASYAWQLSLHKHTSWSAQAGIHPNCYGQCQWQM
jgi:hypothetical protein